MKNKGLCGLLFFVLSLNCPFSLSMQSDATSVKQFEGRGRLITAWTDLKRKAEREIKSAVNASARGRVKKGASPELILMNKLIFFNGRQLQLGSSLESWKKIIPGNPRCFEGKMTLCVWDQLGLEVGTDQKNGQKVQFINISLRFDDTEKDTVGNELLITDDSIGKEDFNPHHAFSGYLELNGFGIDAESRFLEILNSTVENRKIQCGLLDCSNPTGSFADNANIYFYLEGRNENGRIRRIGIDMID